VPDVDRRADQYHRSGLAFRGQEQTVNIYPAPPPDILAQGGALLAQEGHDRRQSHLG
jgi:hypothetical protein